MVSELAVYAAVALHNSEDAILKHRVPQSTLSQHSVVKEIYMK